MKKKVLITSRSFGKIGDAALKILQDGGLEVTNLSNDFSAERFSRIIPEYDALIIGAHGFSEADMERCRKLKIICKHGVGLDNIPLRKARELGIPVCNAPGTNANAVADLTFGLMLDLARKISYASHMVRQGVWERTVGEDVFGKTLGLLGFGAIAKNVARRARGFGMPVLAYDPYIKELPAEFSDFVRLCDLDTVLRGCNFLSLHIPLTEETRNLISAEALRKMKQGAYIINAARGGIVDEQALLEALRTGHLHGAAMDVTAVEPMAADDPLLSLDNVIVTPHMGMYSKEAIDAVSILCAKNVVAATQGAPLQNQVV